MNQPTQLIAFPNFNMGALDESGNQIPALQVSLVTLFAQHAERQGYDPTGWIITTPSGKWRIFQVSDDASNHRWNYENVR